ncbi:glycoside hydrolase family 3 C-terminal domain-containing protein [Actinomadura sp. DC4]|uniref:glycoside hydrolase family 3 C-terminal domain-containing protein n=1 Tax=Actinomadura sp. DC4 TaxID=3055069 RepID=UPI0025B0F456|nr:glycoside hydrolase family 3 C-terminal domain-containing protein [Actinomadura sp. DC4]MDN3353800.1 glycoside hydrolase family 3 C-terminal domain-containing protein [Actinomadura sp. DC4]
MPRVRPRRTLQPLRSLMVVLVALIGLIAASTAVAPPGRAASVLLSQGKPTTASSTENAGTPATAATDGDAGTRWSSAAADPQWLRVDLGASSTISQVVLQWETAYATAFQIQTSADGSAWTNVYSATAGTGGTQTLNITGTGRYVRMYGTARATAWGYSLWEFKVYGTGAAATCGTADSALHRTAAASSAENAGTPASAATDGDAGTRWSSAFADPQWLQVDLGSSQQVCGARLTWEAAYATAFQIQVSADGNTWSTIYSTTTGAGGAQALSITGTGRYVRMYGTARATAYGYSLWEFAVFTVGGGDGGGGDGSCPWVGSTAPVAQRVAQLMAQMTQDQKITMLHGNGNSSPYIGNTSAIPSLCVPALGLHDGPGGVGDGFGGVTQLPAPVAGAATFDTALEQQYGVVAGNEFAGKGVDVALGPTLNIDRDPRWGRGFESFSEDPYLTSQMAVAQIKGVQSQGVMAQAKHAAVYNQETYRNGSADNAIVDTRTLQEIYLPGFQSAVTQGATASVMCGYSVINGTFACQHPYILNTALYQQAGFSGFVTSDWGALHSAAPAANAGMTMEMPGAAFFSDQLRQAVASGQVTQATLDTMVGRVLTQMFAFGLFDKTKTGSTGAVVTTDAHKATARQISQESTVLLKNAGVLPLSTTTTKKIAVIGGDGGAGVASVGGGSATVTSSGTVSPLTGIQNRAGSSATVQYEAADGTGGIDRAVALAKAVDVPIVFATYPQNEGSDNTSIDLPGQQNQLISSVAAANPKTIVVLHTGSAVTMPWLNQVAGVLEGWYSGQEVGNALAAILFGDVSPSGKLPVTFPASLADVPAHTTAQWPGNGTQVQYSEGLKVGYRWYDAQNITPLFPFGYGLSYTTFGFSNLQVGALGSSGATVTATVTDTGARAGAEVAQLYVGDPASTGEPVHQLKGFQRVDLQPGQSQTVHFTVTAHDLAHWADPSGWTTTPGTYQILVGDSSRNLPLSGSVNVTSALRSNVSGVSSHRSTVTMLNPRGMSSPVNAGVSLPVKAVTTAGGDLTFTAKSLPAGLSISRSGVISGKARHAGTKTVTVTATDATGAAGHVSFVWTTTKRPRHSG